MPTPFDPINVIFSPSSITQFPNGIRPGQTLRQTYESLAATTAVAESPTFGGCTDETAQRCNSHYLSAPFGNCGRLNSIGASALAHFHNTHYRYRSGVGHVITEIWNPYTNRYEVVELFANLIRPQDQNGSPFWTMDELLPGPGQTWVENNPIWNGVPASIQGMYHVVQPPGPETYKYAAWRSPVLTLNDRERGTMRRADYSANDLIGCGNLDPDSSPNLTGWPLNEIRIERDNLGTTERIEQPFLLTKIELVLKPENGGLSTIYPLMAWDAVKMRPVAPSWTVGVNAHGGSAPSNYWNFSNPNPSWGIGTGSIPILKPLHELAYGGLPYTNTTQQPKYIWQPYLYRTEAPCRPGDGDPVGYTIGNGRGCAAIYVRDRNRHFTDFVYELRPGETLDIRLGTYANKHLEHRAFGVRPEMHIGEVLSYQNPAYAVDVDLSGLTAQQRAAIKLRYCLMVNPYLVPQ